MNSNLSLPRTKLSTGSSGPNGSINGEYGAIGYRRGPSPTQSSGSSHSRQADVSHTSRGSTNALNRWIHDKLLGGEKRKRRGGPPTTASTRPWKLDHVYDDPSGNETPKGKRSTSAPNLGPRGIEKLMREEYNKCSDFDCELNQSLF